MEENLMCPICGGLHPAGHRDKELEDKLEAVKDWYQRLISSPRRPYAHHADLQALGKILESED